MCKHVAAVMYGIGVRLDTEPELLFKLRGVRHEELISMESSIDSLTGGKRSRRRRAMASETLERVFDIDLEDEAPPPAPRLLSNRGKTKAGVQKFEPTGECIRALRKKLGLGQAAFARQLGVSSSAVAQWEKSAGTLSLKPRSRALLERAHKKARKR